jgi:ABC-type uncharacterized transport system substrate-binding protein
MRRILSPTAAALAALAFATPTGAQEPTPVRRVAATSTVLTDSATRARALAAPVAMARDSALRYERLAGRQRTQGNTLVVAGATLLAGGLLHHYTQDRPMVMSAGSGAMALGGAVIAIGGVRRRDTGARSQIAADLWNGAATTVDVPRRP